MTRDHGARPVRLADLGPDLVLVDRRTGEEIPVQVRRHREASPETVARIRAWQREMQARLDAQLAAMDAADAAARADEEALRVTVPSDGARPRRGLRRLLERMTGIEPA